MAKGNLAPSTMTTFLDGSAEALVEDDVENAAREGRQRFRTCGFARRDDSMISNIVSR